MNWITLKSEVEADIKNASITNKKAIAAILKFERRKNTVRNKLANGASWDAATMSQAYWDAQDILEDKFQEGEFQNEWKAYCDQLGTLGRASMGDHLC